jgi:Fe-S cluster assembly iron-binding protein IscA
VVEYPALFQKDDTNAKIKAVFLYNFTRYFEWPAKEGNFVITIIGDNPGLVAELNKMAASKMVGSQKIEVQNHQSINSAEKSNILFILPDKSSQLADAMAKYKGKGTLIITEKSGLAKVGATINFIVEENKQKFELNKTAAAKAGLKVGSTLEQLAASVIN